MPHSLAALALAFMAALASPAVAADHDGTRPLPAPRQRSFCIPTFDPGVGTYLVCAVPRRR